MARTLTPTAPLPSIVLDDSITMSEMIESLSCFLENLSTAIGDRVGNVLCDTEYASGGAVVSGGKTSPLRQKMVSGTISATSQTFSLALNYSIIPITLYGGAYLNGIFYPLGYDDGTNFVRAYISDSTLVVTTSSSLNNFNLNAIVSYIYVDTI